MCVKVVVKSKARQKGEGITSLDNHDQKKGKPSDGGRPHQGYKRRLEVRHYTLSLSYIDRRSSSRHDG